MVDGVALEQGQYHVDDGREDHQAHDHGQIAGIGAHEGQDLGPRPGAEALGVIDILPSGGIEVRISLQHYLQ